MTSEESLGLDEKQTGQLYTAMLGAFSAVIHFLDEIRAQYEDQVIHNYNNVVGFDLNVRT